MTCAHVSVEIDENGNPIEVQCMRDSKGFCKLHTGTANRILSQCVMIEIVKRQQMEHEKKINAMENTILELQDKISDLEAALHGIDVKYETQLASLKKTVISMVTIEHS